MKPAVCSLCGNFATNNAGDWVEFANYSDNNSSDLSHPQGLEYFCNEHLSAARDLSMLNAEEALVKLKLIYPSARFTSGEKIKASWWKTFFK